MTRILLFLFLIFAAGEGARAVPPPLPTHSLNVAVEAYPPFVIRGADGQWSGLTVELWQRIAHDLGISYRWIEVPANASLDYIASGRTDLALRPYPMNEATESVVDFSDAYFHTGVAMEVLPGNKSIGRLLRQSLFSRAVLSVVGATALVVFGAGFLMWFLERRKNASFAGHGWKGIGSGLWWSSVTLTGVGYGDKIPHTFAGRSVAVVLMFASLVVTSIFAATLISVITARNIQNGTALRGDLNKLRVAVVSDTTGEQYAVANHLRSTSFPDIAAAQDALLHDRADVVIYNEAVLRYLSRQQPESPFVMLPNVLAPTDCSLSVTEGSPWREAINRQLLRIVQSTAWQDTEIRYLGPQ